MCNLSEGIEKKGIEKGVQQGIQQGIEKQKQEMYHTFSIMLENGTPLEQILKALDYPDDFKIWLSKQNTVQEVRQMCNLSEGIEQKGIEKGIQQGIQQMVVNALKSNSI